MGRSTIVLVLACLVIGATTLAACQPLYGARPERLKNPEKKKKPDEPEQAKVEIKYIEDCNVNFRDDPKSVRRNEGAANRLVGDGDTALQQSNRAKDPTSQAELVKLTIEKYRSALIKDPYHPEATLKLAIAYDLVYRKGCALALLKRIAELQTHSSVGKAARRTADAVADNNSWFKGYRSDAVTAVGR